MQRSRNQALHSTDRADRHAFTLVELLIVMVVIAILSSMVIMALGGAAATAKDVHTRATITKLHDLIMQKYESYQTRRVPIAITGATFKDKAKNRLDALRDLMRMEMPDRFTDFTLDSETGVLKGTINTSKKSGLTGLAMPAVTKYYQLKFSSSLKDDRFESAECLYLIIAYGLQDQEALERFSESEVGDFDGDGMPEFIDAWGRPISFLRWAPLFQSEAQVADPAKHHDPFDPLKQDSSAYALFPLIYSGGPDKIYDVAETKPGRANTSCNKPFDLPLLGGPNDPGGDGDDSVDNITNHELLVQ